MKTHFAVISHDLHKAKSTMTFCKRPGGKVYNITSKLDGVTCKGCLNKLKEIGARI